MDAIEFPHTARFRQAMRSLASGALRHPEWLSPPMDAKGFSFRLILAEETSFAENWNSWLLLYSRSARRALIRKSTWRCDRAEAQIRGLTLYRPDLVPQPLIEVRDAVAPAAPWEAFLQRAANLDFPALAPADSIGLDGTSFFLSLNEGSRSTTLEWWYDSPSVWKPLFDWTSTLRERADAAVEGSHVCLNGEGGPGAIRINFPANFSAPVS